jgi:hypothetical protein
VTERLGRPRFQLEQGDDGGVIVVRLIHLTHEGLEKGALAGLHVAEHRVLLSARKSLERLAVSTLAFQHYLPHALDEHPAGARRRARDTVEVIEQVQVARPGEIAARRDQAIQHGLQQRGLRIRKGSGHHRFRALRFT